MFQSAVIREGRTDGTTAAAGTLQRGEALQVWRWLQDRSGVGTNTGGEQRCWSIGGSKEKPKADWSMGWSEPLYGVGSREIHSKADLGPKDLGDFAF